MATQNVKVVVTVTDNNSTKAVIKDVDKLNATIKAAKASAQSVSMGGATGGTQGSRAVSQKAQPTGSEVVKDYGTSRGAAGLTGASSRDFANQAQGLGGLVRLYATYAANIFAVGAAFRALSNAMDTTNMVKGLDQLGAASGMALGSLSRRLVAATDGAVSLREAMEATAKASSSGMNSEQILRMGKAAKLASQALGVDMSDAVSRISRGITKLEPELLDELGIFVRVDTVVKDYAKSVGKSASAITDFEKRMAFANATLTQAEKKFGAIDIESNPYTKLSAAVKDLTQSGLELVNKVLTPVISLLASSPTSLGIVIAGLATMMLKQAIPAFGQYRAHLDSLAVDSSKKLSAIYLEQEEVLAKGDLRAAARAEAAYRSSKTAMSTVQSLQVRAATFTDTVSKKYSQIAAIDPYKMSEKEINALEKRAAQIQKINASESTALRNHVAEIRKLRGEAESAALAGQAAYEKRTSGSFSTQGQNKMLFDRAAQQASSAEIRSLTSQRQALYGAADAWSTLNTEIAKSKAGMRTIDVLDNLGNVVQKQVPATNALQNGMMRVSGAFGIAAGAISKAVAAFQPWILVIILAVEAFALISGALSKNKKQQEEFNTAIDSSTRATDTFLKTIKRLNDQPFGQQFNTEGMLARANAIGEIATAVKELTTGIIELDKNANGWDRFIDGFKTVWGGDARSKFAESMTKTIVGALGEIEGSSDAKNVREQLSKILDIDPKFTATSFNKAIAEAAGNAPKLKQVNEVMKQLGISQGIAASKSKELEDSFKAGKEAYKNVLDTFKIKDPIAKLGESMLQSSGKLSKALEDPTRAIAELSKISKDSEALQLIDPKDAALLGKYSSELNLLNASYEEQALSINKAESALINYNERLKEFKASGGYAADAPDSQVSRSSEGKKLVEERNKAEADLAKKQEGLAKTNKSIADIVAKFPNVASNQFARGANLMSDSISAAINKASYGFKEAVAGSFGGISGAAEVQKKVTIDKINSDNAVINSQAALIRATQENTAAMHLASAEAELRAAREMDERRVDRPQAIATAQKKVDAAQFSLKVVQDDPARVLANIKKVSDAVTEANTVSKEEGTALIRYLTTLGGIAAQKVSNANAVAVAEFTAEITKVEERLKEAKKPVTQAITDSKTELQALDIQKGINTNLTAAELTRKKTLSITIAELEEKNKVLEVDSKLEALAIKETNARKTGLLLTKDKLGVSLADGIASERSSLAQEKKNAASEKELAIRKVSIDIANEVYQKEIDTLNQASAIAAKRLEAKRLVEDTAMSIAKTNLETAKTTELYTAGYLARLEAEQASQTQAVESSRQAEDEKVRYAIEVRQDLAEYMRASESGASEEVLNNLRARINANAEFHTAALNGIVERGAAEQAALDIVNQHNIALAEQAELMDSMVSITASLSTAFGEVGEAIGKAGEALVKMAAVEEKNAAKKKALAKEIAAAEKGSDKELKLKKEEAKLDAKSRADQLDGISEVAGETKKMFKEKTAAHKAFSIIEKVSAAASLALKIQAAAVDLALLPGKIAAGVATMFAQGGFAGFAGAAAFLALMAGLGGGGGGGSVASPGMDAGSIQETQGTGRQYDGSTLTETDWGVLGDLDAKAEDISNSLKMVADYTSLTSVYGRSTKKALEAIEFNTRTLAAQVVKGTNITSGVSGFGTLEKSSPGFLGLFASSTSIIDKGIQVTGQFNDILKGLAKYQEYETVQKTNSGFLGIGKSTKVSQNFKDLPQEAAESIQVLFQSMYDAITSSSKALMGKAGADIDSIVEDMMVNFKVSGEGLSGEDLAKAIQAEASVTMNKIVGTAYPWLDEFRQLGEGFTTTLIRMATTMDVVNEKFRLQGIDFNKYLPKLAEASQGAIDELNAALNSANEARKAAENTAGRQSVQTVVDDLIGDAGGPVGVEVQVRSPSEKELDNILAADERLAKARLAMAKELGDGVVAIAERVNKAQSAYTEARLAILDNVTATEDFALVERLMSGEIDKSSQLYAQATEEVRNLYDANVALVESTALLNDAQFNQISSNLRIYNALVEQMGGLDAFVEKTDYFFENFYSKEEQLASKRTELNTALIAMARDDSLNISNNQMRALLSAQGNEAIRMYRELATAQDLNTESGRATYSALLTLAPAFYDVASAIEETTNKIRSAAESLSSSISSTLNSLRKQLNDNADAMSEDAVTGTVDTYTRDMAAAGKAIRDLIESILKDAAKLAGIEEAKAILTTGFEKDYALAMAKNVEASQRIPGSAKAALDAQTGAAQTTSEARKAMLIMADRLRKLPAVETYEQSLLTNVKEIKETAKKFLTELQLQGIQLDIKAMSKIEKLIQFTVDTERLSPDLKDLLLTETLPSLTKNIEIIQSSESDDVMKNLARMQNIELIAHVEVIASSQASDIIKQLALQSMEPVIKNIGIILDSNLTVDEERLAYAVNESVAKTIEVIVKTDKLTEDQQRLGLLASEQIGKTITLIAKSDLNEKDTQLALMDSEERTKIINVIIEGNFTEDQKTLALQATETSSKNINILINDISLTDEERSMALQDSYGITKTISMILNDESMSPEERTVALQGVSEGTRIINAILQDGDMTAQERLVAMSEVSDHIRNIEAIMKDDKLSPAEKILAYEKELDAIKTIKVNTVVDEQSLNSAEDMLNDALDSVSAVLVSKVDPIALRSAKEQIEEATSSVLATITPESSPKDIATAKADLISQLDNIMAPIYSAIDPTSADAARAALMKGVDNIFATIQVEIDAASAEAAKQAIQTSTDNIMATVGVSSDPAAAADTRGTIESALTDIRAAIQTEVDSGSTADTRAAIEKSIGKLVATISVDMDSASKDKAVDAITQAVKDIKASVTVTSDGTDVALRDSISTTVDGILAEVGVTTDGSELELGNKIRESVAGITATVTVQTDGGEANIRDAIQASTEGIVTNVNVVAMGVDAYSALMTETTAPIDQTVAIIGTGADAYGAMLASLTAPVTQTITIETVYTTVGAPPAATQTAVPSAMGNVFVPRSLTPFALGGLPTNGILNSPLLFDMGVAGEAGPEAIMPLKRGKDGNLGVRASITTGPQNGSTDTLTRELRSLQAALMAAHREEMTLDSRREMAELVAAVNKLQKEVESLRREAQATAVNTGKTSRLLDRAMPTGDAFATRPAE